MNPIKQSIVFIFGITIVLSTFLHENAIKKDIGTVTAREQFLAWNGSHLAVVNTREKAEILSARNNLPTELRPLFFKPIPINHADMQLLDTLPGVGPVTAKLILDRRLHHGNISSREELLRINGIGEKTAVRIEQYITYEL